ncbi:TPA: hypothetical protein GRI80_14930 [Vibrio parahaemolyticus]|uniref:GAPS4b N-terminal domain-containing protein n=1 Tax=Vibrio furnissii TaxID=29494 RepID=A0A0Q2SD59_VIBFU|nr:MULTISPECIES: hypothetical protein [Vibrio]ELA9243982.1 hypothetical protein [Vibrio alginolyticus]HBH7892787.1 hypothetical protein [Vibrio vulnificus]AWA88756.1 hypothetical protein BSG32_06730 [Vibrio parahaemolyticus]EII5811721.1 hypothetical protein [Vibrio parahaemolyticus]EIZ1343082.1 hypothetical protein [Vibrio parahaemolyticus]
MNNVSTFVPIGDILRQFLANPMITTNELRILVQSRGLYSSAQDKKELVPILIKTGIGPHEFVHLKEMVKEREENPKVQTKQLTWNKDAGTTLAETLGFGFNFEDLVDDTFRNLTIENEPQFVVAGEGKDPNHVIADIRIKRLDRTKNFGEDENYFDCSIEFKVDENNQLDLNVTTKHTSKESQIITNEIVKRATKKLKESSSIKSEKIKRILFSDFTNEGRINYLTSLTKSLDYVAFLDNTKSIHIKPDSDIPGVVPQEIKMLEKKIKDLKLKGDNLDSSVFLRLEKLKKRIKLFSISCTYEISESNLKGACEIDFDFPELDSMTQSELTISIVRFSTKEKISTEERSHLKMKVLKAFEARKLELLKEHSFKYTPPGSS